MTIYFLAAKRLLQILRRGPVRCEMVIIIRRVERVNPGRWYCAALL